MGSSLNTPPFLLGTIRPRRLMSQEAPPRVTGVPAAPSECVYFCRQPCGAGETGRLPLTFAPALFQPDRAGWECLLGCATRSSHLVLKPPAASARPAPRGDFPVPAAPGGRAAGVRPAPKACQRSVENMKKPSDQTAAQQLGLLVMRNYAEQMRRPSSFFSKALAKEKPAPPSVLDNFWGRGPSDLAEGLLSLPHHLLHLQEERAFGEQIPKLAGGTSQTLRSPGGLLKCRFDNVARGGDEILQFHQLPRCDSHERVPCGHIPECYLPLLCAALYIMGNKCLLGASRGDAAEETQPAVPREAGLRLAPQRNLFDLLCQRCRVVISLTSLTPCRVKSAWWLVMEEF
nr:type 2 lactosamine alpha-2,3-sialyltransferase isoform X11 [Equus caballus]